MSEVTLRNTRRQPFLATMYHDIVCRRRGSCNCSISFTVGPKGKRVAVKSPQSFQVDAMSKLTVDAAVLHLPMVQTALKNGWLVKSGIKASPAAPAKVEAAPATNGNGKKGRR
jgi:hypothetical protein